MKKLIIGGVVIAIGIATYLCWPLVNKPDFNRDLLKDIENKTVIVATPTTKEGVIAWRFDPDNTTIVKKLDVLSESNKKTVYIDVTSRTKTGHSLQGIMEVYYVKVAGEYTPIGIGNLTLQFAPAKEKKEDKPVESKSTTNSAQPFPK